MTDRPQFAEGSIVTMEGSDGKMWIGSIEAPDQWKGQHVFVWIDNPYHLRRPFAVTKTHLDMMRLYDP